MWHESFTAHIPDEYDFLVAFTTFEFNTSDSESNALAFHWGVQNRVQGIGLPLYDNTAFFGSQGKLQGFIDMAALTRYSTDPLDPDFELSQSTLAHEMLHQWAAMVRFKEVDGSLSKHAGKNEMRTGASCSILTQWNTATFGRITGTVALPPAAVVGNSIAPSISI